MNKVIEVNKVIGFCEVDILCGKYIIEINGPHHFITYLNNKYEVYD